MTDPIHQLRVTELVTRIRELSTINTGVAANVYAAGCDDCCDNCCDDCQAGDAWFALSEHVDSLEQTLARLVDALVDLDVIDRSAATLLATARFDHPALA